MFFDREREIRTKVSALYLNVAPEGEPGYTISQEVAELRFTLEGIAVDRHYGMTLRSGERQKNLYPPGTPVLNYRMWLAISQGDLAYVDARYTGTLRAGQMGVNLLLDADTSISTLPANTHVIISPDRHTGLVRPQDVVLASQVQAKPCKVAGESIADALQDGSTAATFCRASLGYRGLAGMVSCAGETGIVRQGYHVRILVPRSTLD